MMKMKNSVKTTILLSLVISAITFAGNAMATVGTDSLRAAEDTVTSDPKNSVEPAAALKSIVSPRLELASSNETTYPVHHQIDYDGDTTGLTNHEINLCNSTIHRGQSGSVKDYIGLIKDNYTNPSLNRDLNLFDIDRSSNCITGTTENDGARTSPMQATILYGQIGYLKRIYLRDKSILANINSPINEDNWTILDWLNNRLTIYGQRTGPRTSEILGFLEKAKKEVKKVNGECRNLC